MRKKLRDGVVRNVLMCSARGYYVGEVEFLDGEPQPYDAYDHEPSASSLEVLLMYLGQGHGGDVSRYLTVGDMYTKALRMGYVSAEDVSNEMLTSRYAFG